MAVKSSELLTKFSAAVRKEVEGAEKMIDGWLLERYAGGTAIPIVPERLSGAARDELTRRYGAAGWTVKWSDDQREGLCLTLTPTPESGPR